MTDRISAGFSEVVKVSLGQPAGSAGWENLQRVKRQAEAADSFSNLGQGRQSRRGVLHHRGRGLPGCNIQISGGGPTIRANLPDPYDGPHSADNQGKKVIKD